MTSIETTQVDNYVQQMLVHREMSPAARAQQAVAAIQVHVMQEAGLPLTTPLFVESERIDHMADALIAKGASDLDDLHDVSHQAWLSIQSMYPEYAGEVEPVIEIPLTRAALHRQVQEAVTTKPEEDVTVIRSARPVSLNLVEGPPDPSKGIFPIEWINEALEGNAKSVAEAETDEIPEVTTDTTNASFWRRKR